ncbi:MAG: EAL domain-containing protein [Sideroxyarcus sp.]|nr:EAL domain-containing protein [Sideroxyarcus sp.]
MLKSDQTLVCESTMQRGDGSSFFARMDCLSVRKDGATAGVHIVLIDISLSRQAEEELRIAAIAFEAQEGMLVTDANGAILRVNKAFTAITGYTTEEVVGRNPNLLSSGRHGKAFYAAMWEEINRRGCWEGEIWNKRKNGEVYPEYLIVTAVKNPDGVVSNYVATLTDITMSRHAADEIQHLAFYDTLTRLPNRRLLLDRLKLALSGSSRSGREGALLFLDLDNFKTLNDTLGYDIGDLLLQQVAQRLQSCVREGDTVARMGGDEFVVMLEDLHEQDLEAASQTEAAGNKILAALNQPYRLAGHDFRNTVSIGATLFRNQQSGVDEIFKQADIAMYQAKKAGRNTLRFFDPEMQARINARAALESELRAAIDARQFRLYYQIQVDSSRRVLGAEALIRWMHPERGLVQPVEFIHLAEETGLILPIGEWVLETACAQLAVWQAHARTRELSLSVNVSARQFHEAGFVDLVRVAVKRHAVNPMLLKLEPTESILLENIDDTVSTMNALKSIGVHFSLDDFGTGYSSLQYLKMLPLNQLKIDQSFVRDLESDSNDQAIVRTIIAMAHSLELEVIAEGVETEEQRQILLNEGCHRYQGYLFGKPVPIEELDTLLRRDG